MYVPSDTSAVDSPRLPTPSISTALSFAVATTAMPAGRPVARAAAVLSGPTSPGSCRTSKTSSRRRLCYTAPASSDDQSHRSVSIGHWPSMQFAAVSRHRPVNRWAT